jgi:hypothetical protein
MSTQITPPPPPHPLTAAGLGALNVVVKVPGSTCRDEQQRLELHISLSLEVHMGQGVTVVLWCVRQRRMAVGCVGVCVGCGVCVGGGGWQSSWMTMQHALRFGQLPRSRNAHGTGRHCSPVVVRDGREGGGMAVPGRWWMATSCVQCQATGLPHATRIQIGWGTACQRSPVLDQHA